MKRDNLNIEFKFPISNEEIYYNIADVLQGITDALALARARERGWGEG